MADKKGWAIVGGILLCAAAAAAQAQRRGNEKPQPQTVSAPDVYRAPSVFTELPGKIVLDLKRRGCTIPQQAYTREKTNIIRGEFARAGETDWAVLCSMHGVSRILVYWNGSEHDPAEIAQLSDQVFLQKDAAGQALFLRGISAVGKEFIWKHYRAYGGTRPPRIDHQGIDDAFLEKASTTWYLYEGKWVQLTGSD